MGDRVVCSRVWRIGQVGCATGRSKCIAIHIGRRGSRHYGWCLGESCWGPSSVSVPRWSLVPLRAALAHLEELLWQGLGEWATIARMNA